ncbi:hypothetical protein [Xanthomonas phaseoli]|uniref:Uncharacterized protein n=1 Tax=Xanthomonas manihotis TaxID=43353 RepID=A0A8I1XSF5_XANMN|nr:hypothetical protein [Xanthomonas phaseoli]KUF23846.1 hypothetical protein AO826_11905 [Xanthomonas phaseoli pv. manihotis]MBO9720597.1 hypothetical protein [Xanthomonas phaseoli pv. manihotis]MBO9754810.1 hypothetical protein [Xanthomonas phaseoli pv. manihotis]MBO9761079.1 hypothetical protein [Xanthomonas phaseoli pv. manihotis]MBO9764011.1 hypothetical protein [Xanthomonas phaseoli pv. manihotis]
MADGKPALRTPQSVACAQVAAALAGQAVVACRPGRNDQQTGNFAKGRATLRNQELPRSG